MRLLKSLVYFIFFPILSFQLPSQRTKKEYRKRSVFYYIGVYLQLSLTAALVTTQIEKKEKEEERGDYLPSIFLEELSSSSTSRIVVVAQVPMRMACHAARVLRQRHKAEVDGSESDISPEQRKCLESAFEAADKNGDGILSADEYYEIFQTHGLTIGKTEIMMYAMRHFSLRTTQRAKAKRDERSQVFV